MKTRSSKNYENLRQHCPFGTRKVAPPPADPTTEQNLRGLQHDLMNIIKRTNFNKTHKNFKYSQVKTINNIIKNKNLTVTRSDKGGEIVIIKTERLNELNHQHLSDLNTYELLSKDPTTKLRTNINNVIRTTLNRSNFPDRIINRLITPPSANTQRFHSLPKTHKKELKIRPIISGKGGIFERLGWLLQYIFKPLLNQVKAHLNNTQDLLTTINKIPKSKLKGKLPVSLDVISLYTNINVKEAIDTALEYGLKHKIERYGLDMGDLNEFLHLILDNNVFHYDTKIYKQIRGLAMGSRLSGTLAILCLDRFETTHIYNMRPKLAFYVRYVDDIGTVVKNTKEAQSLLNHLNKKHPTIKFELETPDNEKFLPILDVKIKINQDGTTSYKHYIKPANKGIMIHHQSHHPEQIKRNLITETYKRVILCSSPEHQTTCTENIRRIIQNNGYPKNWHQRKHKTKRHLEEEPTTFNLKIPFISDQFNRATRTALKRNNINARLINTQGRSLLATLNAQKKKLPDCGNRDCNVTEGCANTYVIYRGICNLCQALYIGSTMRTLHQRAREHTRAAKARNADNSTFGEHYRDNHINEEVDITFSIQQRTTRSELALRIRESHVIQLENPALNRDRSSAYIIL